MWNKLSLEVEKVTTGEWFNEFSNMLHERKFENGGIVFGQHRGRGYTEGWRSPMVYSYPLSSGHHFKQTNNRYFGHGPYEKIHRIKTNKN